MKHEIRELMDKYENREITLEEANEALARLGASFHLESGRGPGWTAEELEASKLDTGRERTAPLPQTPDLRRRNDLKGRTVRQRTAAGLFDVTYDDETGVAVEAHRVTEG